MRLPKPTARQAAQICRHINEWRMPVSRYYDPVALTAYRAYMLIKELSPESFGEEICEAMQDILPELFADFWLVHDRFMVNIQ